MTIKTFIKKIIHLRQKRYLEKFMVNKFMYYVGNKDVFNNCKRIVMYFPNYEFMHFGDHFFFEPLANTLNKNFDFKIMPINAMKFYFKKLGYVIGDENDLHNCDLIISRKEFYDDLKNMKNVLYIDLASLNIENFVCEDILNKVSTMLNIKHERNLKPSNLGFYQKDFGLNKDDKYIIFNNYVDSASYRLTKKHFIRINEFCKKIAKENGYKVIHTGSNKDKQKDSKTYDFIDIDLRGKTSIEDLFALAGLDNVANCISFDTFIMHIFAIYDKKSYIVFRGRFTKKGYNVIVNNFLPPFKSNLNLIELI